MRLGPGRSAKATFRLEAATDLSVYDEGARRFVVPPGGYTMWVGSSSRDLDERAGFDLGGRRHRR